MKYKIKIILILISVIFIFQSCGQNNQQSVKPTNTYKIKLPKTTTTSKPLAALPKQTPIRPANDNIASFTKMILNKFKNKAAYKWGDKINGVKTNILTDKKLIALTFDACGGHNGSGFDFELISYLEREKIEATLFINYKWIESNKDTFINLSKNPLFEIENHGYSHRPLSSNGKSAYGIKGTSNIQEIIDEININAQMINNLTGRKPKFFRPGTAYCDEIALEISNEYGEEIVGYTLLGDAGATYSKEKIYSTISQAENGSIILCHMNHPEKETSKGIESVIPEMKNRGFKFVKLENYPLK